METKIFLLAFVLLASAASGAVVEHTFTIANQTSRRLCGEQIVTMVNGSMPGPTVTANEGDTIIVHVRNRSPYNMTIHWHGVYQMFSGWADGVSMITQCPIVPGNSFTYTFNVTDQEGTLWWHAHVGILRASVYGAIVILPRPPRTHPFPTPDEEVLIQLGEWWNRNVVDLENEALQNGVGPTRSDAFTINGQPGDLYPCSSNETFTLNVVPGNRYLLRIVNAAVDNQLFFKIAGHRFSVVTIDSSYTNPYDTDVIVIAPGQTVDALMIANQPIGRYYMAANAYITTAIPFNNSTTTAIVQYAGAQPSSTPMMPVRTNSFDTETAHRFYTNLTSLITGPHWLPCPRIVDDAMLITIGLGLTTCRADNGSCPLNPFGTQYEFAGSMNNVSFVSPTSRSMLEASYYGIDGIYTRDFPPRPPTVFDYTNTNLNASIPLMFTEKSTRAKVVRFNATVEMVLQNTAFVTTENHPMHLHGHDFYVVGQGFGNFNRTRDAPNFNLVNPQERNTIAVPTGGWAVLRYRANNPGVWFMHCHLDVHLPWGLATTLEVENGPTPETSVPPPPADLPQCQNQELDLDASY